MDIWGKRKLVNSRQTVKRIKVQAMIPLAKTRNFVTRTLGTVRSRLATRTLPTEELGELLFGQQTSASRDFFLPRYGQCHTIPLKELPHYDFLECHLQSPFADHSYHEYLKHNWRYHLGGKLNTPEHRHARIEQYVGLYNEIAGRAHMGKHAIERSVLAVKRADGRLVIVDGNHRAAIALKLGLPLRIELLSPRSYIYKLTQVPEEFYGSQRLGMPYQSIFMGTREIVRGRRPDVLERMQMLDPADLQGKTVLDLGCNVGANCFVAAQMGARSVLGVDHSPRIITAALRLNAFFGLPCDFAVHDLNQELRWPPKSDTALCFSLYNHLTTKAGIVNTILNKTIKVLYFEGHAGTSYGDYASIFQLPNWANVSLVGYTRDGIHTQRRRRPLFRCVVDTSNARNHTENSGREGERIV